MVVTRWTLLWMVPIFVLLAMMINAQQDSILCGNAGCLGDLECPDGYLLTPNSSLGGCCPGCKKYADINDFCTNMDDCQPGLDCVDNFCMPSNETTLCQSFAFRDLHWSPKCDPDGTFSPVQCKGERLTGRCFCYSKDGIRIFGQEWWNKAENMTCACSRRVQELRETGRQDVTLHCTADGNFEALQCDSGVCWCAEPRRGDALGEVVPEHIVHLLPCYNATEVGDSYLRKCDSASSALFKIREEMEAHLTQNDAFVLKRCGYDGSYAEYQLENGIRYCTWRDSAKIGSYMAGSDVTANIVVDCNCARDTRYFSESGYGFTMQCTSYGDYVRLQQLEDAPICVDTDGFAYQEPREAVPNLVCDDFPIPERDELFTLL